MLLRTTIRMVWFWKLRMTWNAGGGAGAAGDCPAALG